MSKKFAEKIIDSMVDENGFCGPRGLSVKQFNIISECLEEHEAEYAGRWYGDYSDIVFTSTDYTGRIGKYYVELNLYYHFNPRCTVKSITKSYDESEEDLEGIEKKKLDIEKKKLDGINWNHEVGERIRDIEVELTYCRQTGRNEWGETWIYKFTDGKSQFVWFSGFKDLEVGQTYKLSGTVKKLDEFNGVKQTILTRCRLKL